MGERVDWMCIRGSEDPAWDLCRVVYAYLAPPPHRAEILYIGKAWSKTVRERFAADDKEPLWRDLKRQRGIEQIEVIAGLPTASRLTHELLCDIESLLICCEKPWGNDRNIVSRGFSRPGFGVRCTGTWPLRNKLYAEAVLV